VNRWIDHWTPEDPTFWARTGRGIARRNLILSIFVENLGFSVWVLMSIVVVKLDDVGFEFGVGQTFWLLIVPNLVGATLRIPYTFGVTRFGGRGFTTFSAVLLLVPTTMLAVAVSTPSTPYWFFLLTAAAMGAGGGNFSSSMANISFFFPEARKGLALGLNAAGGNLGVALTQVVVPIVVTWGTGVELVYAALVWMPFIVIAAVCAWSFMDSLTSARPDGRSYRKAMANKQTWVISTLYIGTFGSFIGYSFAFPTLIDIAFPAYDRFVALAFLGALIGSAARPAGGWLADRSGGAKVTLAVFAGMALGVAAVIASTRIHSFPLFFCAFLVLFTLAGAGNGATYRMIPAIFALTARRTGGEESAERQAAAVIGTAGAIGAFGGVLVNLTFTMSLRQNGSLDPALYAMLGFYAVCLGITWWYYVRRRFAMRLAPSLAQARI
jgi:NNP family nitrate/nitrite transporter-like MFS transporter